MQEALPLESKLADNLHDFLNSEVASGTITSKQEAVDWLTLTFLFRRLGPNPNFYNLASRLPAEINNFIS
jgi:replicative superfamily II helicase